MHTPSSRIGSWQFLFRSWPKSSTPRNSPVPTGSRGLCDTGQMPTDPKVIQGLSLRDPGEGNVSPRLARRPFWTSYMIYRKSSCHPCLLFSPLFFLSHSLFDWVASRLVVSKLAAANFWRKKKTQTTKTRLVKTVCASLKVVGRAGGEPVTCRGECAQHSPGFTGRGIILYPGQQGAGDRAGEQLGGGREPSWPGKSL